MTRRVTICYFGITRSLSHTLPTIEANLTAPARALCGEPPLQCAHLFRQDRIENPRTGESQALDPDEHTRLALDRCELEPPGGCLETWDFEGLKTFGDVWDTGFHSLRNLVHQLHSLDRVTSLALEDGAEIVIFARPDLSYHDSLERPLRAALRAKRPGVWLPWWQAWFGYNDRFAIAVGRPAIEAYGRRIRMARAFCEAHGPLHAESLVAYALHEAAIPVHRIGCRASRVRADGQMVAEEFTHPVIRKIRRGQAKLARLSGWRSLRRRLRG